MNLVHIEHISDGHLTRLEMSEIPRKGEIVNINHTEYEVVTVKWNLSGLKIVTLIVEEPSF
jgi:hypothetical protein